ncbi:hypothetical protein ScPMuIL_011276 [Solemya velum]
MAISLDWFQCLVIAFLLLLPIIYELSTTFKYYAKFTFYYTVVMLLGVVVMIYGLWRPKDVNNYKFVAFFVKQIRKLFGITVELRGSENLKSDDPYILVCNHQSSLDFFGMMEVWPERCTSLAKKELLYAGPFGPAAWLCGTIFIDRLNKDSAITTISRTVEIIKSKNVKVFVFPEGTRNHGGSMLPFKKGAFYLAVEAQVPIVPVVFSSLSDFYSKREKKFTTGKFIATCLPKISTEGLGKDDVENLTDRVRNSMLDMFNQTSLEATQGKMSNGSK